MKVLQRLGALSVFLVAVVVLIVMQFAVFHRSNRQMAPLSTTATSMLEPTATVTTAPTTTVTTTTAATTATTATPTSTATTVATTATTTKLLVNNNNNDRTTPRPNRTLVIVMGNLRCGELAWTSLKERVLDVNSADLALMLGYTLPRYQNSTLFDRAKYVWNFTEYDDWGDAMDEMERDERKRVIANNNTGGGTSGIPGDNRIFRADDPPLPSWRETVLPRLNGSVTFGGVKGYPGCCPGGGIAQNYARYNIQKKIRELNLTSSYDRFMIARSDSFFKFDVNFTRMSNDYIWVPAGCGERNCDFGGLNDRQVIVSSKDVLTVLDGYPRLARSDASGYKDKLVNGNPESFLKDSFIRAGVMDRLMRYTQPFYSCIATGDQLHVVAMALAKSLTVSTEDGVDAKKKFEYEPIQDRFQQCGRNPACLDQDSDYFSHYMRFSRNRTTG